MDLPAITDEKVLELLTKEWQPITSLISKLMIKDLMVARSLQITLKSLELQKKILTRVFNGKKHWKLYDKRMNKRLILRNKLLQREKINKEIKLLKEKLDFLNDLENKIQGGITGYELVYELKDYSNTIRKKIKEMNNIDSLITNEVEEVYLNLDILKKVGNNKVLDYKFYDPPSFTDLEDKFRENGAEIRERLLKRYTRNISKEIIKKIKEERLYIINEIGYLEFLKQKQKPEESKEKIDYEKDLDDFTDFLDEKFKEWEQIRSKRVD